MVVNMQRTYLVIEQSPFIDNNFCFIQRENISLKKENPALMYSMNSSQFIQSHNTLKPYYKLTRSLKRIETVSISRLAIQSTSMALAIVEKPRDWLQYNCRSILIDGLQSRPSNRINILPKQSCILPQLLNNSF